MESGACIIDVREPGEYAKSHIKTAVNIPLSQLRSRLEEIPRDRPVYLHCRSSQRSYNACLCLQAHGFTNVYNISGSYLGISFYEYFKRRDPGPGAHSHRLQLQLSSQMKRAPPRCGRALFVAFQK